MKYPLFGSYNSNNTPTNAAVRYFPYVNGSSVVYTTESQASQIVSEAMTLSKLYLLFQVAPGAGTSWNLTVMKNGSATALSVTVSDTNLSGSDTTNSVSFAAGDTISIQTTPTGSPAYSSGLSWHATAESTNQVVLGKGNATTSAVNNYMPIFGTGGSGTSSTEANMQTVMPSAGTFSKLYAGVSTAPGAAASKVFTLYKNGVAQTLTCTISNTGTTASDTSNSFTVAAGDTVSININFTGIPAASYQSWGVSFAPTTAGETFIGVPANGIMNTSSTNYALIPHKVSWGTTDDYNIRAAIGAWRFKKIYIKCQTAAGAGKKYTAVLRQNGADTALTVDATNTTTSQGASSTIDLAATDLINVAVVPTGTPTASRVTASFTVVEPPITVTPSIAILTLTTFAPTVTVDSTGTTATPSTASLSTTTYAPTVSVSDNKTVTPDVASLTLSSFAPTVTATDHKTVTPDTVSLSTATFAPTVTATDNKTATPDTASLSLTTFDPTVAVSDNKFVTPDTASLTLTTFEPNISAGNNATLVPVTAALTTTAYSPEVAVSDNITVTPSTAILALIRFAPTVSKSVSSRNYYIDSSGNVYWVINQDLGLVEKV